MAFDFLLWESLLSGRTSHGEDGKSISTKPVANETLLFFLTDTQAFRQHFQCLNENICDVVVFCKRSNDNPRILFVELKGSDVDHAVLQIERTWKQLCSRTHQRLWPKATCRALIVMSGSAQASSVKAHQQDFIRRFKMDLQVKSGVRKASIDIRTYLQ